MFSLKTILKLNNYVDFLVIADRLILTDSTYDTVYMTIINPSIFFSPALHRTLRIVIKGLCHKIFTCAFFCLLSLLFSNSSSTAVSNRYGIELIYLIRNMIWYVVSCGELTLKKIQARTNLMHLWVRHRIVLFSNNTCKTYVQYLTGSSIQSKEIR